jgi:V8-like Glu-specific endopeptidase
VEDVILYDIDTTGGQSGSPVYILKDSFKLVAIHKGYHSDKDVNCAALITEYVIDVV